MESLTVAADVLPESLAPYLGLMVAGFLVAIWGHGMNSRWTVATGIIMIFLASLLLPLALQVVSDRDPPERDFQTPAPLRPR